MPRVTLSVFVLEDSEGWAGLGWADWADWAGLAGLGWGGVCEEESIDVPLTDHQPTSSRPWALMSRYILQPSDKPEILDIRC